MNDKKKKKLNYVMYSFDTQYFPSSLIRKMLHTFTYSSGSFGRVCNTSETTRFIKNLVYILTYSITRCNTLFAIRVALINKKWIVNYPLE